MDLITYALLNKQIGEVDSKVDALSSATKWIGVTTTALSDGASTNPIIVNGESVTVETGNIASYNDDEFVFNGSIWQQFGSAWDSILVCTFSKSGNNIVCDKTITEIVTAAGAGKDVLAVIPQTVHNGVGYMNVYGRLSNYHANPGRATFEAISYKPADGVTHKEKNLITLEGSMVLLVDWWALSSQSVLPEIPDVTSADNGKVLGVSGGEWSVVAPSGNLFEVLFDYGTVLGDDQWYCDKTFNEIVSAYNSGANVVARINSHPVLQAGDDMWGAYYNYEHLNIIRVTSDYITFFYYASKRMASKCVSMEWWNLQRKYIIICRCVFRQWCNWRHNHRGDIACLW